MNTKAGYANFDSAKAQNSVWRDLIIYASRVEDFDATDWAVYFVWVGLMLGLFGSVTSFLVGGAMAGVQYPTYVWNIPVGIFIFAVAISFDTIGHRTVYKDWLREKGEALVHHVTIFAGITSTVLLILAYHFPGFLRIPVMVLLLLSVFYSMIDEAMHWVRYATQHSDRIEMVSHFFIFLGHNIMVLAWWKWFDEGYVGVHETALALHLPFF
ncbi:MAG: hypothetical protein C5B49_07525 [Bdellovibrio sp.]|nr:MAG: hypothetical protein C5B49_07525 [Bdellovibrio sp.]